MQVTAIEPYAHLEDWSKRLAHTGFSISSSSSEEPETELTIAVEPPEPTVADLKARTNLPRYDITLVPGSLRIVTTVMDSSSDLLAFRIPSYWNDSETALSSAGVIA